MAFAQDLYVGRRLSYDGSLCTVRCLIDSVPGTKGEWLGIEWDDPLRGKHDGTYQGKRYFHCVSSVPTAASFVRPTRKIDPERTILEAIQFKYGSPNAGSEEAELITISGKVAEEVGFEKIRQEQAVLTDLRIAILDHLTVSGLASRGSSPQSIKRAQAELAFTCPEIVELDIGFGTIENLQGIEDICKALPKLRTLKLNGSRLQDLNSHGEEISHGAFQRLEVLHLNETLVKPEHISPILGLLGKARFPVLNSLWLSKNEINSFELLNGPQEQYSSITELILEHNLFTNLDSLSCIMKTFPNLKSLSLQVNQITNFGAKVLPYTKHDTTASYPNFEFLNVATNKIDSFKLVDQLPLVFPNLKSLRISQNPVYEKGRSSAGASSTNPTETSYYLTLARIPSLKVLNFTNITVRERDEGEIYFLSVAEKEIKAILEQEGISSSCPSPGSQSSTLSVINTRFPLYQSLCEKHDRDSIIAQLASTDPTTTHNSALQLNAASTQTQSHPPGSLASRLLTATFYIPRSSPSSSSSPLSSSPKQQNELTRSLPSTIPSSTIFALLSRHFSLPPLQFKLVYESTELDPVQDDITTRSLLYKNKPNTSGRGRWDDWGDWDIDDFFDRNRDEDDVMSGDGGSKGGDEGKMTADGYLMKDGKKWKKREVDILSGMRAWGDCVEEGNKEVRIRIELRESSGRLR